MFGVNYFLKNFWTKKNPHDLGNHEGFEKILILPVTRCLLTLHIIYINITLVKSVFDACHVDIRRIFVAFYVEFYQ